MKKKFLKAEKEKSALDELHRPANPRQYRPKKISPSRNPAIKSIGSTEPIEQARRAISTVLPDQTLQCSSYAPRQDIIAQIKIGNDEYRWGLEAEDFDDLNPYIIEVKQDQERDLGTNDRRVKVPLKINKEEGKERDHEESAAPSFELVTIKQEIRPDSPDPPLFQIKQEALDLEDIVPNYTLEMPPIAAISQEIIKAEPPDQPVQIKQEELDLAEIEDQNMDMVLEDDPIETIVVDDEDESGEDDPEPLDTSDALPGDAIEQDQIATICVDDSDDESARIKESTNTITNESQPIVHFTNKVASQTPIYNYEHRCVPRRIYHNSFLQRFAIKATYRGYGMKPVRLLNGGRNQLSHIYACDICNKLCASQDLIKQHVTTHPLKRSKKHPQLFVTAECSICFKVNLEEPRRLREHLNQEHPDEIYRAAKGQKFAIRIECGICRRWFPMNECMECGEEFDRTLGITWHHRMHRKAEKESAAE